VIKKKKNRPLVGAVPVLLWLTSVLWCYTFLHAALAAQFENRLSIRMRTARTTRIDKARKEFIFGYFFSYISN
jgi:hypothetical protein